MIWLFNPLTLLLIYIAYTKSSGIYKKFLTAIGAIIDCAVNLSWFTIIFFDIPKEWLLTQRVERLKYSSGYRGKLANLICKMLNYYEPNHCN